MTPTMLYGIALMAVPVLLSLTLHEYGHARVAQAFGDPTAAALGRTSLNPLMHLDLLGTLCFIFGPFGWAKPVPVDFTRLRPYRVGDICVSLAGVGMNLALLILATVALNVMALAGVTLTGQAGPASAPLGILAFMLSFLMIINLTLIIFNLIPLYPLDGHHVVRELLPRRMRADYMDFQRRLGGPLLLAMLVLPWLVRRFGGAMINPVGWLLGAVIVPVVQLLLSDRAIYLFAAAWDQYGPYLPWG